MKLRALLALLVAGCAPVRSPATAPVSQCAAVTLKRSCPGPRRVHDGWPCAECWRTAKPTENGAVQSCVSEPIDAYCVGAAGCVECPLAYEWSAKRPDAGSVDAR